VRSLLSPTIPAAIVLAGVLSLSPADARERHRYVAPSFVQDRYCLQGRQWGYPGNCQFSTYEQCLATASGTTAGCGINPVYAFELQSRGYWDRLHNPLDRP
jgi:Protein of unknown function (DUF3551)